VQRPAAGTILVKEIPTQQDHVARVLFREIQDLFQRRKGIVPANVVGFAESQVIVRADHDPHRVRIGILENHIVLWLWLLRTFG
jgi:hypothetical protein